MANALTLTYAVPDECNKNQTLYFYIDATSSNTNENFCPLIVVLQMLVAAFNPSPTSGTKIGALLFSDETRNKPPSTVFDMGTSCSTAMQGPDKSLKSLMIDFGVCLDNGRIYDSSLFPSSCGEGTSAVKGLEKINNLASSAQSSTEKAILMVTDGVIMDDAAERTKVLNNLNSTGVKTIIAAGINTGNGISTADVENLKLYTSENNILVGSDPVELGIDIVNKMEERGILCQEHGNLSDSKLVIPNYTCITITEVFVINMQLAISLKILEILAKKDSMLVQEAD